MGNGKWRLYAALILGVLAAAGWWVWPSPPPKAEEPPVPVVEGVAERKDVPVYLEGLGTVQAWNTVTLRVRVDGQLTHIAFAEGQDVSEGDLLAVVDPAPFQAQLDAAIAKKKQDEAQLRLARINLQRDTKLRDGKVISQQDYDTQKALADQLEATVAADDAAIDTARVQLGYTSIYAPISGRIGLRLIDKGNIVNAASLNGLIVITQMHPIAVIFTLPEQYLPAIQRQIRRGKELPVQALERGNTQVLATGALRVISNQIDPTTGTIQFKAEFTNEDLALWPGQFVNARLQLDTLKNATVVPTQSILRGPEGSYVFVIGNDERVKVQRVKTGPVRESETVITEGLRPGERVVVEGQYRLEENSKVSAKK